MQLQTLPAGPVDQIKTERLRPCDSPQPRTFVPPSWSFQDDFWWVCWDLTVRPGFRCFEHFSDKPSVRTDGDPHGLRCRKTIAYDFATMQND